MAAEDEYYQLFDEETNGGKVLDDDWSNSKQGNEKIQLLPPKETLTPSEDTKRNAYITKIKKLFLHYIKEPPPEVTSPEAVLRQRVVAPCLLSGLTPKVVAKRSGHTEARALRGYPDKIHEWVGFARDVTKYKASTEPVLDSSHYERIFMDSLLLARRQLRDEGGEQENLLYNLQCLVECGIVETVSKGDDGFIGQVDFTLQNGEDQNGKRRVTVICESKSTQNLLLPILAEDCVKKFNEAYDAEDPQATRHPPAWSMVCHPLGHFFGYLQDNQCPFGALTSGTRTYFVSISGNNVKISDAWFVGQQDYLRAWAYVHSLGCKKWEWKQPTSWKKSTKTNPTPTKGQGKQQNQENQGTTNDAKPGKRTSNNTPQGSSNEHTADIASLALPNISYNDIVISDVIGDGRNGSCFKVVWKGQDFAMKQFDMGKRGDAPYRKEISAYMRLRDAWGKLVPQPMFLSESPSGWVKFLGLQLGRMPNDFDDLRGWNKILRSLEQEYGIRHNDAEERNMIFIADNVSGGERMVTIDLEDWDDVSKARSF
jgi:hypothetical protein